MPFHSFKPINSRMKTLLLVGGLMLTTSCLQAQSLLEANFYSDNYRSPGLSINYGQYLGTKKHGHKNIRKGFQLGLRLAFHHHPGKHTVYIFQPYFRYEHTGKGGGFWQPELSFGYLFKKNNQPTYQVKEGQFGKVAGAGHHRLYPAFALGLGYDFRKNTTSPFRLQWRPGVAFEYPNNTSGLFHFQSELGIGYQF